MCLSNKAVLVAMTSLVAALTLLRMGQRRRARQFWRMLERGHYLPPVGPPEVVAEVIAAMKRCLEMTSLPLAEVHQMRKMHAKAACAATQVDDAGKSSRNERLVRMMRQVAVCTGPNFKDHLRAHVLASPHFPMLLMLIRGFIHEHVLPYIARRLGERSFAVQCHPSMRFNLPGSSALGARAEDSDEMIGLHTDAEYGHQGGEMNFMLALTDVFGSNGLFVESEPGRGDFMEV
jgi:hypothetical protein